MRVTYNFARTIPVYWHYTIIPFPIPKYLKARAVPQRAAVSSQLWLLKVETHKQALDLREKRPEMKQQSVYKI